MGESTATDGLHEKLQLVGEDVKYLKSQFSEASEAKLSLHLPTDDSLKVRVKELVEEFIQETFEMARHSMVVNGVDMTTQESLSGALTRDTEAVEPFDVELNEKLRNMYAQVDEETMEVTKLRRQVPEEAKQAYLDKLQENEDALRRAEEEQEEKDQAEQEENDELPKSSVPWERIQEDYHDTLKLIHSLVKSVPEVYSGLNELQEALEFVRSNDNDDGKS